MSQLPASNSNLLVRTDFTDVSLWNDLLDALSRETVDGFRAYVDVVDDERWDSVSIDDLRAALPESSGTPVLFAADRTTLATPDHPILVVDARGDHAPFRCIAAELWGPDNNLSIGNMGFHEFADAAGPDRVFRGFLS
jgi:hypothetical protein